MTQTDKERDEAEFWGDTKPWTRADLNAHEAGVGSICESFVRREHGGQCGNQFRWCARCGWDEVMHEIKRHVLAAEVSPHGS